eukprot:GHVU01196756.1.p3 GENE.GHVU01196756.1~~GHVU01196756.1.p3  ORF type:complete len:175 (+),score=20.77 GHVU01196756.1:347-871(+)
MNHPCESCVRAKQGRSDRGPGSTRRRESGGGYSGSEWGRSACTLGPTPHSRNENDDDSYNKDEEEDDPVEGASNSLEDGKNRDSSRSRRISRSSSSSSSSSDKATVSPSSMAKPLLISRWLSSAHRGLRKAGTAFRRVRRFPSLQRLSSRLGRRRLERADSVLLQRPPLELSPK